MAAWEGSRMRPLTDNTPKPLLKICGKTIIEHNIEHIVEYFDDIYMVVAYKKEMIESYFWDTYKWKKMHYIDQIETKWTWAAILSLDWKLEWEFVVLSGDDIYETEDVKKLIHCPGYATLCKAVDKPENFGIFTIDSTGKATGIIEKPTDPSYGNLANIWNHKFDSNIFPLLKNIPLSPRGELEITDLIDRYIKQWTYSVVEATGRWITIWYPWDLLKANEAVIGKYTETVDKWAIIEPQVTIKWNVYLEKWVILKSGTYIEGNVYFGEWCEVGPFTHIRGSSSFWKESRLGSFSEVKNCYLGDDSVVAQGCVVVDTIAGIDVNIASWVITTNWRHDNANIKAMSKWALVDTGRRKLWAIIGDHVRLWANTTIYPGRVIPSGGTTLPGEIVRK